MVNHHAHIAWVQPLPFDPANFTFTELSPASTAAGGLHGVMSVGRPGLRTPAIRPASALFAFVGSSPSAPPPLINLAGGGGGTVPMAVFKQLAVGPGVTHTVRECAADAGYSLLFVAFPTLAM